MSLSPEYKNLSAWGYQDPEGKYPNNTEIYTSSVGGLVSGQYINNIPDQIENTRRVNIPTGNNSKDTWSQPHISYNAKYPYNAVRLTRSGHLEEWDDTPGHERIMMYHRSGTFKEVNPQGTQVNRIVGDNYEIVDRNGFISISGQARVSVSGNIEIYCQSDAKIKTEGNAEIESGGDLRLSVAGDFSVSSGGNMSFWSDKGINLQGKENGHIYTGGDLYLGSKADTSITAENRLYVTSHEDLDLAAESEMRLSAYGPTLSLTAPSGEMMLSCLNDININSTSESVYLSSGLDTHIRAGRDSLLSATNTSSFNAKNSGNFCFDTINMKSTGSSINVNSSENLNLTISQNIETKAIDYHTQTSGEYTVKSAGVVALDGNLLGLNSNMSKPVSSRLLSVDEISPEANPASEGISAVFGLKPVVYSMDVISAGSPLYPNIPPMNTLDPDNARLEGMLEGEVLKSSGASYIKRRNRSRNIRGGRYVLSNIYPNKAVSYDAWPGKRKSRVKWDEKNNRIAETVIKDNRFTADADIDSSIVNMDPRHFTPNFRLSEHFILNDLFGNEYKISDLTSQAGLSVNQIVLRLALVCQNVLEPLYIHGLFKDGMFGRGKYWNITSGFRTTKRTPSVSNGGSSGLSHHCLGQAVDLQFYDGNHNIDYAYTAKVGDWINRNIPCYQIIFENRWLHVDYWFERRADGYNHMFTEDNSYTRVRGSGVESAGVGYLNNAPWYPDNSVYTSENNPNTSINYDGINVVGQYGDLALWIIRYGLQIVESNGKANAVSSAGAKGLTQMMVPATRDTLQFMKTNGKSSNGSNISKEYAAQYLNESMNNPNKNIELGTNYLSLLLNMYHGDVTKALTAYNVGYTTVNKAVKAYGNNWHGYFNNNNETRDYANKVIFNLKKQASYNNWLADTGLRLGISNNTALYQVLAA